MHKFKLSSWVWEQLTAAFMVFSMGAFPDDKVVPVLWGTTTVLAAALRGLVLSNTMVRLGVLFSRDDWNPQVPVWASALCDMAIFLGFVWTGHIVVAALHGIKCLLGEAVWRYMHGMRAAMGDDYPKYKAEWEAIKAKAKAARGDQA